MSSPVVVFFLLSVKWLPEKLKIALCLFSTALGHHLIYSQNMHHHLRWSYLLMVSLSIMASPPTERNQKPHQHRVPFPCPLLNIQIKTLAECKAK